MKQDTDRFTKELPVVAPVPGKRGPKPKLGSLTPAQRQAAYRARKAAEGKVEMSAVFLSADTLAALQSYVDRQNKDVADKPLTLGEALDRIVRDRLLRKR